MTAGPLPVIRTIVTNFAARFAKERRLIALAGFTIVIATMTR